MKSDSILRELEASMVRLRSTLPAAEEVWLGRTDNIRMSAWATAQKLPWVPHGARSVLGMTVCVCPDLNAGEVYVVPSSSFVAEALKAADGAPKIQAIILRAAAKAAKAAPRQS